MKETKEARFRRGSGTGAIRRKWEAGTKAVLSFGNADAGHRFISTHHASSAGWHAAARRQLCRRDLSSHQSISSTGWQAG